MLYWLATSYGVGARSSLFGYQLSACILFGFAVENVLVMFLSLFPLTKEVWDTKQDSSTYKLILLHSADFFEAWQAKGEKLIYLFKYELMCLGFFN